MGSVIYIIIVLAINSLFKSSLFKVIELFFFFIFEIIQVNHIINNYKYVFNYYKYIFIYVIINFVYIIRF